MIYNCKLNHYEPQQLFYNRVGSIPSTFLSILKEINVWFFVVVVYVWIKPMSFSFYYAIFVIALLHSSGWSAKNRL